MTCPAMCIYMLQMLWAGVVICKIASSPTNLCNCRWWLSFEKIYWLLEALKGICICSNVHSSIGSSSEPLKASNHCFLASELRSMVNDRFAAVHDSFWPQIACTSSCSKQQQKAVCCVCQLEVT